MPFICPNCGNSDENHFLRQDPPRDDYYVCTVCGECDLDLDFADYNGTWVSEVVASGSVGTEENSGNQKPTSRKMANDGVSTYHRRAHLMERLSQALCREPQIEDKDLQTIREIYEGWKQFDPNFSERVRKEEEHLSKKDVQRILRFLNAKEKNTKWTTKYLEKWKSVSRDLYNLEHHKDFDLGISENDVIKIGSKFIRFSNLWDEYKKSNCFPERKHFPNYNFILTLIANDLCNIQLNPYEFPLPSLKCQARLIKYYLRLAQDLNFLKEDTKKKYFIQYQITSF